MSAEAYHQRNGISAELSTLMAEQRVWEGLQRYSTWEDLFTRLGMEDAEAGDEDRDGNNSTDKMEGPSSRPYDT
jgi:transcription elongation factor Elf1